MGVELGKSDLTISIVEADHPRVDHAASDGVILKDHRTTFERGIELDDFEKSWEADADVEKDAEYVSREPPCLKRGSLRAASP